jgi:hypothetical protein
MAKKNYGKTNRTKGHNAERHYVKEFQELGFAHCKTARLGSRLHDYAGIDLICLPFNVQVKAGKQVGMKPSDELEYIENRMVELFPETAPEHVFPKVLIHRKQVGQGKKRTAYHDIVSMTFEDFKKLISKVKEW